MCVGGGVMWSAQGSSRVRASAAPLGECQCDAKANSLFWLSYTEQRATQSKGRGWHYCAARSVDTLLHPIMHSTRPSIDLGKSKYRAHSLSICSGYKTDVRFGKLQEIRKSPQTSSGVWTRYGIDDVCNIRQTPKDPNELDFSQQSAQNFSVITTGSSIDLCKSKFRGLSWALE